MIQSVIIKMLLQKLRKMWYGPEGRPQDKPYKSHINLVGGRN